jgi:glycosyltransferase involved in cell wall biosynthesis
VLQWDKNRRGAPWARNEGFRKARTELVLFSDDDILWERGALKLMIDTLDAHPEASYCYGAYLTNWCDEKVTHLVSYRDFDAPALRADNYISTMAMIRSTTFPGFDESLRRLQDWDLWLTMLDAGHVGVWCKEVVFKTTTSATGITFGSISWEEAAKAVRRKHSSESCNLHPNS